MSYGRMHYGNPSKYTPDLDYGHLTDNEEDSDLSSVSDYHQDAQTKEEYEMEDLTAPHESSRPRSSSHGHDKNCDHDDDGDSIHLDKERRGSTSTMQSFVLYTPDEERLVVRKLDRRLALFVAFLYMLSFLDRSSA